MRTELERTEARMEALLGQLRTVEKRLSETHYRTPPEERRRLIDQKNEILDKYRPMKTAVKRLRREIVSRPEGVVGQLSDVINRLAAFRDAFEAFDEILKENRRLEKELGEAHDYARELQAKINGRATG